ncbi:hypothetical protein LY76DRAFT_237446 [Colletotrichum caudatum]|nr:hypothetical protein LY76DRAFT_237446 [Colletotrichum caudatum]
MLAIYVNLETPKRLVPIMHAQKSLERNATCKCNLIQTQPASNMPVLPPFSSLLLISRSVHARKIHNRSGLGTWTKSPSHAPHPPPRIAPLHLPSVKTSPLPSTRHFYPGIKSTKIMQLLTRPSVEQSSSNAVADLD